MKKVKMIIALALCLVMVLGISATAFAQDPQIQLGTAGKITKDNVSLRKDSPVPSLARLIAVISAGIRAMVDMQIHMTGTKYLWAAEIAVGRLGMLPAALFIGVHDCPQKGT